MKNEANQNQVMLRRFIAEKIRMERRPKKESTAVTKPPIRKTAQEVSPAYPPLEFSDFLPFLVGFFVLWQIFGRLRWFSFRKRISQSGYVIVRGQLEHRKIAEHVLGRKLIPGEVVHHINGVKTDNRPSNLCVLSSIAHEDFHSWLRWKLKKEGSYPPKNYQRAVLRDRYSGTLLVTYPNDLAQIEAKPEPKPGLIKLR